MRNFPSKEDLERILALLQALHDLLCNGNTAPTKWLKTWQVCEKIGVTKNTLRKFCEAGLLQPTKVGRLVFYNYDEVVAMMQPPPGSKKQ